MIKSLFYQIFFKPFNQRAPSFFYPRVVYEKSFKDLALAYYVIFQNMDFEQCDTKEEDAF